MKSILLLHGALGSKDQFSGLIAKLEEKKIVYAFNFEGHGGRSSERAFTMEHFAENVIEFLDEKGIDKIDVFGYSMGGYVALKCALLFPERIGKILTLGTKFNWSPESAEKEVMLLNPELIELKFPKFAQHLSSLHAPLDWKEVMKKTAEMMLNLGNGQAIQEEKLMKISQTVLICRGTEDIMVSDAESKNIVNLLPSSLYLELENTPHPIEKVEVDKLLSLIANH